MSKFLYIFIFISNLSTAQIYYSHYINETSIWRYKSHQFLSQSSGCHGQCGINSVSYVTEYIDGTINFNGYTYYKKYLIFKRFDMLSSVYGPEYIREDSNGNFYSLNSTNGIETKYYDNSSIQSIENGTPINNYGNMVSPTSCNADVSYITVDGLNLKKIKAVGYKIEGIAISGYKEGLFGGGMCSGVTYTNQQFGPTITNAYDLLYSYTKNGSTYVENSTGGSFSDYPVPTYLNTPTYDDIDVDTKIFPNPTTNKVNILSNSKISLIEVYDVQGKKIKSINLNDFETKFDFSNYQNGTYVVKISTDLGKVFKKIIKE